MTDSSTTRTPSRDFVALFGAKPTHMAEAPGRVNLIGDHTDYNGGFVLPMPMPQRTRVDLRLRNDGMVHLWSESVEESIAVHTYRLGSETKKQDWTDYVQGVTWALSADGHPLNGFDIRIESSIPLGAGLSSSASLLVAVLRGLRNAMTLELTDHALATLAYRAETEFVDAPVGIMDHMVCSLGRPHEAFFLDTATLEHEYVAMPQNLEWVVLHSGLHHHHATGSYRERRQECETINNLLGLRWLRDLEHSGLQSVLARIGELPPPLDRRARHVITENQRVLAAMEFLQESNARAFGTVMSASHESLRKDYEVSTPDIDLMVKLASDHESVYGARLTGGGFGGSVVLAAAAGSGREVAQWVAQGYRAGTQRDAVILLPLLQ
ncbi:MAG: galactokinase [Nitrospira sp.]